MSALFLKEDYCSSLIRTIKFNRFLNISIALNLLIYTLLFALKDLSVLTFTTIFGWVILIGYVLSGEIFLKIAQNNTLNTEETCTKIFNLNVVLTAALLLMVTLCTGNKEYLFLSIIPVFHGALQRKKQLIASIIGVIIVSITITEITGWFNADFLSVNQFPLISKLLSFTTVIAVLSSLGIVLAKIISRSVVKSDYLHGIATTDALTGLLNRREFNRRISQEFARAKRHKSQLSLAFFDIDFFKKINDTYGHAAGDTILSELGNLISNNIRTFDISARYGGEEFVLILPETNQSDAYDLMDRIRELVEKETFNKDLRPIKITISVGVAQLDLTDAKSLDFCERADKALYKAKENGRNRVERAPFGVPKVSFKTSSTQKVV